MISRYKNVVGIGQGYKNDDGPLATVYMVNKKLPLSALDVKDVIPKEFAGQLTDVIQVGEIRAQEVDRKSKLRPAPGGSSIGHFRITAGTLGGIVVHPLHGRLILSNNHVLADSNDAEIGDPIYQPGPYDGGEYEDVVASLNDFEPIDFGDGSEPTCSLAEFYASVGNGIAATLGSSHRVYARVRPQVAGKNIMDAALAKPLADNLVSDEILGVGLITGASNAFLGMNVRKSGRTTGLTSGQIIVMSAIIEVSYGDGKTAIFENQIVTSAMSQGGDSGSLLVEEIGVNAVGLLFAGSDEATIHSPIKPILDRFGVSFV